MYAIFFSNFEGVKILLTYSVDLFYIVVIGFENRMESQIQCHRLKE